MIGDILKLVDCKVCSRKLLKLLVILKSIPTAYELSKIYFELELETGKSVVEVVLAEGRAGYNTDHSSIHKGAR